MKQSIYRWMWKCLITAWTNGKVYQATINGLGDVKSMYVVNGDLVIIIDGKDKL